MKRIHSFTSLVLKPGLAFLCFFSVVAAAAQSVALPEGGVFLSRNGEYEGVIGKARVFFSQVAGGVMSFAETGKDDRVADLDMVFMIRDKKSGTRFEVRQSYDKSPRLIFLEEGNDRIGMRVLFKLFNKESVYLGHGMTETWIYPEGQVFITAAAMFENIPGNTEITKGKIEIKIPRQLADRQRIGKKYLMNDSLLPQRFVMLTPEKKISSAPELAIYWKTGRLEHDTYLTRSSFGEEGAPSYYRWPDYFRQAYVEPVVQGRAFERWPVGRGVYLHDITLTENGADLNWPGHTQAAKNPSFNTLIRLSLVADKKEASRFVEAERSQIRMQVAGGLVHENKNARDDKGYNDQEGSYEVRKLKKEEPLQIILPADESRRTVRIKAIALTGHGAVTATLDGKPLLPQLTTDGGIADDPLAPITELPEGPANAAMVTVKLTPQPQKLVFNEEDGIQVVYQSRSAMREFAIYSTRTGPRWSGTRFSLIDGRTRNMRAYGKQNWALTENLLHWFPDVGYTPEQMINSLRDFVIIRNGPDEIAFKYTSHNIYDGARSEFTVSSRADAPAMQINVKAVFTVLTAWPYDSNQFFDIFPFRGVEVKDWWYNDIFWLTPDGRWKTEGTVSWQFEGDKNLTRIKGPGFFGLYSSDRGNMLMLTKNFKPAYPTDYVICGNYTDFHMSVSFLDHQNKAVPLRKGFTTSVEYELAVWGDEKTTRDQLIEIGKKSLENNRLVLPQ